MKTYITSDLHLGHTNIQKFCPETRGRFRDIEDMNETMVQEWNDIVQPEDTVYILGDVAFLPANKATELVQRLKGQKILIEGNHDVKLLRDPGFRSCFAGVHPYLRLTYNRQLVILFHYPIWEWDQMHRGSVQFFGHVHGGPNGLEKYRARDVGFDATGNVVTLMDDLVNDALKGEVRGHHKKD